MGRLSEETRLISEKPILSKWPCNCRHLLALYGRNGPFEGVNLIRRC